MNKTEKAELFSKLATAVERGRDPEPILTAAGFVLVPKETYQLLVENELNAKGRQQWVKTIRSA